MYYNIQGVEINGDRYEAAIQYLDRLVLKCPDYEDFRLNDIMVKCEFDKLQSAEVYELYNEIIDLFSYRFKYTEKGQSGNLLLRLTDLGREAKKSGGHFAYLRKQEVEQKEEGIYKNAKSNKIGFDKKIKIWTVIVATLTLVLYLFFNSGIKINLRQNALKQPEIIEKESSGETNHSIEHKLKSDTLIFDPQFGN